MCQPRTLALALVALGLSVPAVAQEAPSVSETERPFAAVREMMDVVSPERLRNTVDRLVGFGTRHTLSSTYDPTRGIGAARNWLKTEMEAGAAASGREGDAAVRVAFDTHAVKAQGRVFRDVDIVNVVATIPGSMKEASGRTYYVLGHYDSRASDGKDTESDAPGANDDASGVAVLVELARVMATKRWDSTLVFMAVAGEEQGLHGSRLHAHAARKAGVDVRAVLSNDIVGDPSGLPEGAPWRIRVFSEGIPRRADEKDVQRLRALSGESDSGSRQIARYVAEVAELHRTRLRPQLIFRPDRFLRGGDHLPWNELGVPAVRFTDVVEQYHRQHQDLREEEGVEYGDTPEHVNERYMAEVARLNGAVLGHLANAPSEPGDVRVVAARLTRDTTLRWTKSPEPDTAGYEVVWRETTGATWQHAKDVGDVTEATIDLCKDDWFFGVRAYDRDGYRSPVVFAGVAKE
ncbi:MAG: M28 family metallopeptidase [Planctomycetota bacterium]|jgi:Zn-dependent M28 family amino/carboxypeptidase